jgi:hypothetical protein
LPEFALTFRRRPNQTPSRLVSDGPYWGRDGFAAMALSVQDQRRMAELHRLFEERGWRLRVDLAEDGSAVAWFHPRHTGASAHEVHGRTPLEAALVAWAEFKTKPYLSETPAAVSPTSEHGT